MAKFRVVVEADVPEGEAEDAKAWMASVLSTYYRATSYDPEFRDDRVPRPERPVNARVISAIPVTW